MAKKPRENGFIVDPATRQAFIMLCAVPKAMRPKEMRDQKTFAKKYQVSTATLAAWKAEPNFQDEVWEETKKFFRGFTGEIVKAMYETAKKPGKAGTADRKLWLQSLEKLAEKQEHSFPELEKVHGVLKNIVEQSKRANKPGEKKA